jgi:hypothetical protein
VEGGEGNVVVDISALFYAAYAGRQDPLAGIFIRRYSSTIDSGESCIT